MASSFKSGCALRALWVVPFVCFSVVGFAANSDSETIGKFGKTLVDTYEIPPKTLAEWAEAPAPRKSTDGSPLENILMANTIDWFGPQFKADAAKNPYTIAVILQGRTKQAGSAITTWQAGWRYEDGMFRGSALPVNADHDSQPGESVTLVGAVPSRFDSDKEVSVYLGLVNVDNFEFVSARVELWQGIADATW
jgi:hypothetical protein